MDPNWPFLKSCSVSKCYGLLLYSELVTGHEHARTQERTMDTGGTSTSELDVSSKEMDIVTEKLKVYPDKVGQCVHGNFVV